MQELDLLLAGWLERRWPAAQECERLSFQWLLEQPDPDLADWLLGGARPGDARHAALIDDIVCLHD